MRYVQGAISRAQCSGIETWPDVTPDRPSAEIGKANRKAQAELTEDTSRNIQWLLIAHAVTSLPHVDKETNIQGPLEIRINSLLVAMQHNIE